MNKKLLLLTFCLFIYAITYGQPHRNIFSRQDVQADLKTLHEVLPQAHVDPFAYTQEETFDAIYERLQEEVQQDSLSLKEAHLILQPLVSSLNNGHTEIDFPKEAYIAYAQGGGTLFPLEIVFEEGKYLVRENHSSDPTMKVGEEVTHINGRSMDDILVAIYPQSSAERTYFKHAKIELYTFPRYYWLVFGEEASFEIKIRHADTVRIHTVAAVEVIEGFERKHQAILNAQMKCYFIDSTAYLNPGNFSGDFEKYQQFIDSSFSVINKAGSENLILDFRNNGGGNDDFSDYLISYIADQPFYWCSRYRIKTSDWLKAHVRKYNDTTGHFFQEILDRQSGEVYTFAFDPYAPQDQDRRFKGNVYVLVNRQSHSQSTVAAAQIQDYQWGTIVGEETGEYATLYASQFQVELPRTGLIVSVSKAQMVRINGDATPKGVIPDIIVKDHLLDEQDEILDTLLVRLKE
ncbi:MAG: S41 family peptidase [Bacteroidota bacterium]